LNSLAPRKRARVRMALRGQVGALQVGVRQIQAIQPGMTQVQAAQVRPREVGGPPEIDPGPDRVAIHVRDRAEDHPAPGGPGRPEPGDDPGPDRRVEAEACPRGFDPHGGFQAVHPREGRGQGCQAGRDDLASKVAHEGSSFGAMCR